MAECSDTTSSISTHVRSKMAKEGYIEAFKPTVLSTHEDLDVIDDDLY